MLAGSGVKAGSRIASPENLVQDIWLTIRCLVGFAAADLARQQRKWE